MAKVGGFGVTLTIGGTTTVSIEDIELPEFEKELTEITAHDSASGFAEWLASGLKRVNELTLTLTWDKGATSHAAFLSAFNSSSASAFVITMVSSAEVLTGSGQVKKLGRVAEKNGAYRCKVTIQPTGAWTAS